MEHIQLSKSAGILTISFARQDKKNAITDPMYKALADGLIDAQADPQVRVVLIRSEGNVFTAGNDIADFAAGMQTVEASNVSRFFEALASTTKPIVAAVQGPAVGIGVTMLLHCDYVLLSEAATLSTPFVSLALVPEAASTRLLPARIGYLRAFEMFALGEPVSADTALSWGLASRVVAAAELEEAALAIANRLAAQPLGSLMTTKRLMRDAETIKTQMASENVELAQRLKSAEAKEAFSAFLQRRKPDFTKVQ